MAELTGVVFDAVDAEALAGFWAAALGWRTDAGGSVVRPPDGGVELRFRADGRPKQGKNRLHLDLAGGPAEVARLLGLGAVRVDIGQGEVPWEVLADPEGNEFCVLPEHRGPADARLAQLCLDADDPATQGPFWAAATGWTVVERAAWGVCLRDPARTGPALVMGPPATAKTGRNRLRFLVAGDAPAFLADPEGNEYEVGPVLG
ncbi:VOC family protein [Actinacidiphila paucisporea]|uniref:Glyoxalase-like domain-containing protein n=1 Tax=Actinacidiphila paucisporea TaxID=310782 RepID=A0A1M7ITQ7_9ACTN|nr:VOC family protein [Actinacidiphila paucisporea]SHM43697.1 hypothetical protein SAMN05216499_11122 [Actinacidiphila paucisporea]